MGAHGYECLVILGILIYLKQASSFDSNYTKEIICYKCDVYEPDCADPFRTSETVSCSGHCYKWKAKASNSKKNVVARGCDTDLRTKDICIEESYRYNTTDISYCVCNGNLCNYATPVGSSIILMATSIVVYNALQ